MRGVAYFKTGKTKLALSDLLQAIKFKKDIAAFHIALGDFYLDQKAPAKAVEVFTEAIRLDPRNARVFSQRGVAYLRIDLKLKASLGFADFERAAAIDPDNALYQYHIGAACHNLGDVNRADSQFRKARELDPSNPRFQKFYSGF